MNDDPNAGKAYIIKDEWYVPIVKSLYETDAWLSKPEAVYDIPLDLFRRYKHTLNALEGIFDEIEELAAAQRKSLR
jgi:hypothetical protein